MSYTAEFYVTSARRSPVEDFILSLDIRTRKKFYYTKNLLEKFGYKLTQPHAKYIGDEIFELRFKGAEGAVRVFYFFFNENRAILTNGFVKKTNKTPAQEKKPRFKDEKIIWNERMNKR